MIRVARIVEKTRAEGPGMRFSLWVQGCTLRCPGCYAKKLQDPRGGTEMHTKKIIEQISQASNEIEGITLLGGEPFQQAGELSVIARFAQEQGLSVVVFTGYRYEWLLQHGSGEQRVLLTCTDVLIDGPYLEAECDFSRPLVGSKNQRYLFLTDRYSLLDFFNYKNRVEIRVGNDGKVQLNGMGNFQEIEKQLKDI